MKRTRPGPEQESVWDYPRPPRIEPETRTVRIILGGETIAATNHALRVLETSHPPGIYVPPEAFAPGSIEPNPQQTVCEWKGSAVYWDLSGGGATSRAAAWSYPEPRPGFESIAGYVSVYPGRVDACYLGDEVVRAQEGTFYGGWITDDIVGPFKGGAGTTGW